MDAGDQIVKGSTTGSGELGSIPLMTHLDVLINGMRSANTALERKIETRLDGLEQTIDTRLDAMDKAIVLFSENLTRAPTDVDRQVKHLGELHNERFHGIATQFAERDERVKSSAEQTKTAVAAALQAAKEAVNKQETAFGLSINKSEATVKDQIEALATTLRVTTAGIQTSIADIKERVATIEATGLGRSTANTDTRALIGLAITILLAAIVVVGAIASAQ